MKSEDRKVYLDILKIFACFAVILQHNADLSIEPQNVWDIHFLFYYLGRFAVPIFVMVSGVLLLDEKRIITIRGIFTKYIPRILLPLIGIVYVIQVTDMFLTNDYTWKILYRPIACVLTNNVSVPYWYIYMLIGLYLILPFVRKMVHALSKKEIEYFLVIFLFVRTIIPFLDKLANMDVLSKVLNALMLNLFSGYLALLVLGYYLDKYVKEPNLIMLLVVDLVCLALPLLYVFVFAEDKYNVGLFFADIFSVNMLFHSILLFMIAKKVGDYVKQEYTKLIVQISGMTFAVYILHVYILQVFNLVEIRRFGWGVFQIPVCTLLNFMVSIGIVLIGRLMTNWLRRKPYAKK